MPPTVRKSPTDLIKPGSVIAQALPAENALDGLVAAYRNDFAAVMPSSSNAESFIGLALAYVRRDKFLSNAAAANPLSLVVALREIAAWGHMPMKGTAALVAYRSNRDKHPEDNGFRVVAVEEVGGTIQRVLRAGGVSAIHADVFRERDEGGFNRTRDVLPRHIYDEFCDPRDRGPMVAAYAYATTLSGAPSAVVWMTRHEIDKHRALSRSGDQFWGPAWPEEGPWTVDMWKKTVIHKLEPLLPSSSEYRWQVAASEAAAAQQSVSRGLPDRPVTPEGGGGDWIAGEVVDPPDGGWPAPATPAGGATDG